MICNNVIPLSVQHVLN